MGRHLPLVPAWTVPRPAFLARSEGTRTYLGSRIRRGARVVKRSPGLKAVPRAAWQRPLVELPTM
jgi:hypothetical protein